MAKYLILRAALPHTKIENIGILLFEAESNELHCRYRRDWKEFAGKEADVFELLPEHISEIKKELGAEKCLKWMESKFGNAVRLSARKHVVINDYRRALNELYEKHIRPQILKFQTHLPQYSIQAAAGKFGKQMDSEPEGWVEVVSDAPLNPHMFVTHVTGHSMEPLIPDASLCAFQGNVQDSWDGRILLIEHDEGSGGNRFTIKRIRTAPDVDTGKDGDDSWLHLPVTLESLNPSYKSWNVPSAEKIKAVGEFIFVVNPAYKEGANKQEGLF